MTEKVIIPRDEIKRRLPFLNETQLSNMLTRFKNNPPSPQLLRMERRGVKSALVGQDSVNMFYEWLDKKAKYYEDKRKKEGNNETNPLDHRKKASKVADDKHELVVVDNEGADHQMLVRRNVRGLEKLIRALRKDGYIIECSVTQPTQNL